MADTTPNALEVADKLDHLASHLVSDRSAVQQAAELIRALYAALADGWISVDERLPMQPDANVTFESEDCLVTDGARVGISAFARGGAAGKPWACWSMYGDLPAGCITHWMTLPKVPAPPTLNASGEV